MVANAAELLLTGNADDLIRDLKKVVQNQQKIVDSLKKTGRESKKLGRDTKGDVGKMNSSFMKLTGTIKSLAGGFIGAAGLSAAIGGVISEIKIAGIEIGKFEDNLSGLLSLGENVDNIDEIKQSVIDLSGAFGFTRQDVIDAMFDMQSGAGNLSKVIRDELLDSTIQLSKVTGADLKTSTIAMLKTWLIYGDQVKDVNRLQAILFRTAQAGVLNFQDLAQLLPDVAATAKGFGNSIEEVSAALIVASKQGGSIQKTFTGVRNIFLKMNRAIEMGLTTIKPFVEQVEDLAKVGPAKLQEVFGAEAISQILTLTSLVELLKEEFIALNNVQAGGTKGQLAKRLKDDQFFVAETLKLTKQQIKNIQVGRDFQKELDFTGRNKLRQLAIEKRLPGFAKGAAKFLAPLATLFEEFAGKAPLPSNVAFLKFLGIIEKDALLKAGQLDLLEATRGKNVAFAREFSERLKLPSPREAKPTNQGTKGIRATPGDGFEVGGDKVIEGIKEMQNSQKRAKNNTNNLTE